MTPALLRTPAFTVGLGGIALFFAGLVGSQLVLTRYPQIGQHFTAGEAGIGNLPLALGTAVGGAVSGAVLADGLGRAVIQIGPFVQLVGAALLWYELADLDSGAFSIWDVAPGVAVAVVGSVFFDRAGAGEFGAGFRHALIVQACLLVVFLGSTFLLPKKPKKGRPEDEQHAPPEPVPGGTPS